MANPHQDNNLENTPQDGSQDDHQYNNSPASRGQYSATGFERCFTTMYPFQASVMSNLNRSDFRNLRLAGVKTPISPQIQRKYLIPTQCDEWHVRPGIQEVTCSNTTKTVDQIWPCHGLHHDDPGLRVPHRKWVWPGRLFKHVRDSNALVQTSNQDEGGHFDSFNVCIHCHDRVRQLLRPVENAVIGSFYSTLCQTHCLEYVGQRPYNDCRCKAFMEKHWTCHDCSVNTLEELKARAYAFWEEMINKTGNLAKVCPIPNCTGLPWLSGPLSQRVCLCRACTAIFPQPQ